jgi:LysR family nitrogen assimilation transcriptional regulator
MPTYPLAMIAGVWGACCWGAAVSLRFRQIRYFVETVDAGSMNRAAARLNLVPNALSLQIKALEENYRIRLLDRHARGVTPTQAGRKFYGDCQRLLRLAAEAERSLMGSAAAPVVYRIGVIPSVIHAVGFRTLRDANPDAVGFRIELVEGLAKDLTERLKSGDIHYAITTSTSGERCIDLLRERLVYVTSPLGPTPSRMATLADIVAKGDLIRFGNASHTWEILRKSVREKDLELTAAITVESTDLLRRMVMRGVGSAVLPLGLIEQEWRAGKVSVWKIDDAILTRRVALLWRDPSLSLHPHHAAIRKYATLLLESYYTATEPFSEIIAPWAGMAVPA